MDAAAYVFLMVQNRGFDPDQLELVMRPSGDVPRTEREPAWRSTREIVVPVPPDLAEDDTWRPETWRPEPWRPEPWRGDWREGGWRGGGWEWDWRGSDGWDWERRSGDGLLRPPPATPAAAEIPLPLSITDATPETVEEVVATPETVEEVVAPVAASTSPRPDCGVVPVSLSDDSGSSAETAPVTAVKRHKPSPAPPAEPPPAHLLKDLPTQPPPAREPPPEKDPPPRKKKDPPPRKMSTPSPVSDPWLLNCPSYSAATSAASSAAFSERGIVPQESEASSRSKAPIFDAYDAAEMRQAQDLEKFLPQAVFPHIRECTVRIASCGFGKICYIPGYDARKAVHVASLSSPRPRDVAEAAPREWVSEGSVGIECIVIRLFA